MPDLPFLARYVIVAGHTGPLIIDTRPDMLTRKKLNAKYRDGGFSVRKADAPGSSLNYIIEHTSGYRTICGGIPTLQEAETIIQRTIESSDNDPLYGMNARSAIWGKGDNIAEVR